MKNEFNIINDIQDEISRQDDKWTEDRTNPSPLWAVILMEEVGEVARAILEKDNKNAREELVQVGALAAQMISAIDRGQFAR